MSWLHGLRERLLGPLRGETYDRELEEEIRFHLELETARQIERGQDPAAARSAALARFGDPALIHEATREERGSPVLESNLYDLRWALRLLRKQAGFSAIALVTLALGIGVSTSAFTVLNTVLLRPLPYEEPDRLVLIRERTEKKDLLLASFPNFEDWRARTRSFSGVVSTAASPPQTVFVGTEPLRALTVGISAGFLAVLGARPVVGREFDASEAKIGGTPALMVSEAFWKSQMGGRLPLGTIRMDEDAVPVIGVVPPNVGLLEDADIFYAHERGPGTIRNAHRYRVIARLAPGVALSTAQAEMTTLSKALHATYGEETLAVDADVKLLRDYLVGDYRGMIMAVFGAAALVLLIACTNLVSAQLARGFAREREVALRTAVGASHGRLVRQLFIESAVLAVSGSALGAGFAVVCVRLVRLLGSGLIPRLEELRVDGRILAFAGLSSMVVALLIGIYPALRLAGGDPGKALRGSAAGAPVRASVWRILVGFEIAMAVVLLVASTLLIRTLHNILTADTGFDARGVVTASLEPSGASLAALERLRAELASVPGATGAAFTSRLPLSWGEYSAPVLRPGDSPDHDWPAFAGLRVVTPGYFEVMRQPVLRGRPFTTADGAKSAPVAIITPGIASRLWPGEDPIGKQIRSNYHADRLMTVVGLVAEASSWTMPRGMQNEIYTPLRQWEKEARGQLVATVRTDALPAALIPALRERLRQVAPGIPARFSTMEKRIAQSAADRRFAMFALTLFGGIALLLAGVGIYGVVSYAVETRRGEIGVRMALGATSWAMIRELLGEAVTIALGGIVIGSAAGYFASLALQHSLYGVSRLDPTAYAVGAGVLLITALAGAFVPARRTSRIDPMVAMRGE